MTEEEFLIKLGFKTDQLEGGTKRAKQLLHEFQEGAEHSFVHAESKGRSFKKVLHEISDVSPLLGLGIRAFLDPTVAIMLALVQIMKDFEKEQEKAIKQSEEIAKHETEHYMHTFEGAAKAAAEIRKGRDEHEKFLASLNQEKPAEAAKEKHAEAIEDARQSSATESEFLQKKKMLDLNEQYVSAERERVAIEALSTADAKVNNDARIRGLEDQKNKVKLLIEAQKEAALLGFGGGKVKDELLGAISKHEENLITQSAGAQRADIYGQLRQKAEAELNVMESAMARDKEAVAEAKTNVTDFHKAKTDLKKADTEDSKKLFDAQRKEQAETVKHEIGESKAAHEHNKTLFLEEKIAIETKAKAEAEAAGDKKAALELEKELRKDNLLLASAQKDKAMEQANLDRDLARSYRHRKEAETKEFMPTLKELADSMPWQPDIMDQAQRQQDAMTMRMGMAFGQKHAVEAQDEIRLKEEMKRALFIEGPDSERFKRDAAKLDSLKKGLAAAGLQTSDDRLESIDKSIQGLLDKASKEGLVVQPVNGA